MPASQYDSNAFINAIPCRLTRRAMFHTLGLIMGPDAEDYPLYIDTPFTSGITVAADGTTGIDITSAFTGTTGFLLAGTATNGISITGACTTAFDVTGAFTTGISIAAGGTTGIEISSAFTGVTGMVIAGTASGDGILISGACADGIHISGTNTASGLHISGDQAQSILIDVDAAVTDAIYIGVDDGITATAGLNIDRTGTTGVCTTAIRIDTDGTTAIDITSGFTGTTGIVMAGTATDDAISVTGACTDGVDLSGAMTNYFNVNNVGSTSAIGLHCIDAFLGKAIETGTYQSTASGGITLTSTNNRPVSFLFDDAGVEMGVGSDVRATVSRVLLTVDHTTASTINALRGQLKANDLVDMSSATGVRCATMGYLELAGTGARTVAGYTAAIRASIEEGASGTTTVSGSSFFSGVESNLASGRTYTLTGEMAAFATTATSTADWDIGLLVSANSCTTGVEVQACTTGMLISGATTTPVSVTGAFTTGVSIAADGTTGIDITSAFTGVTGINIAGTASGDGILVSGACADGIQVSGTNTATALHVSGTQVIGLQFEGTYSDSAITIGTSGSPISLAAQPDHAIDIYTTSPSTDAGNSVRPIHMTSTMAGIGGVGGRAEFEMTSNVALGGWANALKGYFNMGDSCTVTGLGSAVLAELKLPGASLGGVGSYAVMEMELVTQANGLTGAAPVAFQWMQVSGDGTATADFEDNGYLMVIKGLTEGTGNIFSAGADVAAAATLKILVGTTPYYILLGAGEST
jgi:hypothetical protein